MKQTTCAVDTLFSASHPHLYKHISILKILVSSVIALIGVAAVILSLVVEKSDDTLSMVLLTVGFILLLFAVYRLFWQSYETVYRPTGSSIRSGSLYMDSAELQRIRQMVEKNDFSNPSHILCKDSGNGRLDYLMSKDGQFVAVQFFQFVPYTYEPISEKYYYTDDVAAAIARCINI
ncbi:MAG: hypothetical protein IKU64_02600 [Bacteroides sp.]|nr:hypothetical protein [Bacteroides sp.]